MDNHFSYRNIWKIAYPIILGSLAQDIITIADTAFAGRLGEIALGSIALGGIFYLALIMLGFGFGIGVQVLIARRHGENYPNEVKKIWYHSFVLLFIFALFIFTLSKLFTPTLLKSIVSSNDIFNGALSYLNIRIFGIFAAFMNIGFRAFYIGTANTKVISYTTILMAIINILFDYWLIFGVSIFPKLGISGAALASVISEYSALAAFILFTRFNADLSKYRFSFKCKFNTKYFSRLLKLSTPTMLQNFISLGSWFVFFIFVEKMGSESLAISNIIRSIYIILLLPIMGFSSATNSLVSFAIGKNMSQYVPIIIKRSIYLSWLGIGIINAICLLMPNSIISIFTNSQVLIDSTVPVFYVVSAASFLLAFGFIVFNAVTGTANTISSLLIEIITILIYLTGVNVITSLSLKIEHVWMMELFYGSILGTISLLYLKYANWNKKVI